MYFSILHFIYIYIYIKFFDNNKEEKNLISEPQLYDEFLIKDAKNDKSSLNPNIKGQNYQVEDTNNNMNKSKIYPSQPSGRNNFSLSKEFNDPDLGGNKKLLFFF